MKNQIRKLRIERGLTQGQVAKELGYHSVSIITMWESGERKPPSDKLPALAKVLSCSICDLFE